MEIHTYLIRSLNALGKWHQSKLNDKRKMNEYESKGRIVQRLSSIIQS